MESMTVKQRVLLLIVGILLVLNCVALVFILDTSAKTLKVSFLDVGQGDAIFIESPTGAQVLIDGGRDRSVLRELGKVMGPFDRSIEVVVETHPDADHIGGLPGVFGRYQVDAYMAPGISNDTNPTVALIDAVEHETNVQELTARRGMRLNLGKEAYMEILFPDRDVSNVETNTGSIVARVVYGDTSFLLTGDSPIAVEEYLVSLDGDGLQSTVLKAGHHGSRTSTSDEYLSAVHPDYVVISAGKDNTYGHPHKETLERIRNEGATILSTMGEGTVTFVSNGRTLKIEH